MTADATERVYNVLFLCTGNSARSILAEALLNRMGEGRFRAFSAGSMPKGEVNPHVGPSIESLGYDLCDFRSKSWDEFAAPSAPPLDVIITVCDNAAGEACPVWPGQPITAHWGIPDPAAVEGSEAEMLAAFEEARRQLEARIRRFLALPRLFLDAAGLKDRLREIGETAEATP
jgi:arsenate reductase (thioredoxin)